jgi:hypothetical protein
MYAGLPACPANDILRETDGWIESGDGEGG